MRVHVHVHANACMRACHTRVEHGHASRGGVKVGPREELDHRRAVDQRETLLAHARTHEPTEREREKKKSLWIGFFVCLVWFWLWWHNVCCVCMCVF